MASVPSWKQALLEKKRRQDEEDRRRNDHENKRLSEMPSWKRELILKKKKSYDSSGHGGYTDNKGMVIIDSAGKHSEGVNGRSYYPEFGGSQRTTPDSGFDESEDAAQRANHSALPENRWVQANSTKGGSHVKTAQDTPDGVPVANGIHENEAGDSDEELQYQPGFVHKLLDKFSHMSTADGHRIRRVSQGGTEYSDDSGGSAKSSPRYESDNKQHPSKAKLHGSNENLLDEKVNVSKKNRRSSREDSVPQKDIVHNEKVDKLQDDKALIIGSSRGARKTNGSVSKDTVDGKVVISSSRQDNEEEPPVKNIVSSFRTIFESGKKRSAPAPPKVPNEAVNARQSVAQPVHNHVSREPEGHEVDDVKIVSSQQKPLHSSNHKHSTPETQNVVVVTEKGKKGKPAKKGTPTADSIQKIREAGQSWYYGKDEKDQSEQNENRSGATEVSSMNVVKDSVNQQNKVENVAPAQNIKEIKTKPEPPRNIEIKPKIASPNVEKKRTTEPPSYVEVKTKSRAPPRGAQPTDMTMVEVKVRGAGKTKGGPIIVAPPVIRQSKTSEPSPPPRKRQAPSRPAQPENSSVKSRAPPPTENNNVELKMYVKVNNVTTDHTDVDTGKIIITDTEEDEIPVTNIDDMILDDDSDETSDDEDNEYDFVSRATRKVAPPSGIDTHLDLSSITNDDVEEVKVSPIPSPVRPCNISFIGGNVRLDRSLLERSRMKDGRFVKFNDGGPEVHEYPSELTMLSFYPEEEQENVRAVLSTGSEQEEESRDMPDGGLLSNPGVNPAGSVLGNYKSRFVGDYQLGSAPSRSEEPKGPQRIVHQPEPEPEEEMQIKPADEDETYTWSETTSSDMLF